MRKIGIHKFEYKIPNIVNKKFPTTDIRDLVGVQPMASQASVDYFMKNKKDPFQLLWIRYLEKIGYYKKLENKYTVYGDVSLMKDGK